MDHDEDSGVWRLPLGGALTLRTAEATHAALMEACARHDALEIACAGADDVDLSFVQLLLAARASAARSGRAIRLAEPPSGVLRAALERGGFLTEATPADLAFWSCAERA